MARPAPASGHIADITAVTTARLFGQVTAISGGDDGTVRIWDLGSGTLRTTLTGHEHWVNAVACTELNGTPIAITGSSDRTVRVWDLARDRQLAIVDFPGVMSGALAIGPANEIIVGAGWDLVVLDRRPR
jgi:WD40 repeat protein